jgi:alanine racemase
MMPDVGAKIDGRPTWAEIDLGALRRNLARVRERGAGRRVIAVVKADAYGHGAVAVSRELVSAGCEALAVATLEEAEELRAGGIAGPILLLEGVHQPGDSDAALELEATPVLTHLEALPPLEAAAERAGRSCPVHLKFDTGMGRLGFTLDEVGAVLDRLARTRRVECRGLMSHLADADDPDSPTPARQRERFSAVIAQAHSAGLRPDWIHLDNSAALAHGPTPGTTAVRVGLLLYGADPTLEGGFALEPVMTLCTRVMHQKSVPKGTRIGYGGTFTTSRSTCVLTLPLGYADGLPRATGGRFSVGLRGRRVPLVGRVSMDLATVDAGPELEAEVGEEILVFGRRKDSEIRVEELARAVGTIAYEILVGIGPRVPRVRLDT